MLLDAHAATAGVVLIGGRQQSVDRPPGLADTRPVAAQDQSSHSPRSRGNRWFVLVLVLALAGAGAAAYRLATRHVFRVTVEPGEVSFVDVEVPMQRLTRSKSFTITRAFGLPVTCTVSGDDIDADGVRVWAVQTNHTVHHLKARLRVRAGQGISSTTATRSIDFSVDGEDGWPTARLVVKVRPDDSF
jgi:hypothetical protein